MPQPTLKPYFYPYTIKFDATNNGGNIANGAVANGTINILNIGDFVIQQLMGAFFTAAGAIIATPLAFLQVVDLTSSMQLFDSSIPVENICGSAQLPYILPTPRTIRSNGSLQVQVTNNNGAAMAAYITLAGQMVPRG